MIVAALKRTEERITHVINTGDGVDQGRAATAARAAAAAAAVAAAVTVCTKT